MRKILIATLVSNFLFAAAGSAAPTPGATVCESQSSGFTYQITIGASEPNAPQAPAEVRTYVDKSTEVAQPETLFAIQAPVANASQSLVQLADASGQVVMAIATTKNGITAKYKKDESLICRNGARK